MRLLALKRSELERLLRQNGFEQIRRRGSHNIWHGKIGDKKQSVVVDQAIDNYSPSVLDPLYFIVMAQLGFFRDDLGSQVAWERFYGGDAKIANRAGVEHRRWDDPNWQELYGQGMNSVSRDGPHDLLDLDVPVEINPPAQESLRKLSRKLVGGVARILKDRIDTGMRVTAIAVHEDEDPELENWRQLVLTVRTPLSPEAAFPYWEQLSLDLSLLREQLSAKDREILDTYVTLEVKMEGSMGV